MTAQEVFTAVADPFDSADYYSCDRYSECLSAETPEEAIEESRILPMDRGPTITVYAFARQTLNRSTIVNAVGSLLGDWLDDQGYAGPDDPAEITPDMAAAIELLADATVATFDVWACRPVAQRDFPTGTFSTSNTFGVTAPEQV